MKFKIAAIFFFAGLINLCSAQIEVKANMGINYASTPSLYDYINRYFAPSGEQINSFSASVVFAGEAGYYINNNFQIGLEAAYNINSFSYFNYFQTEINVANFMPTLTAYYVYPGKGYNFKLGGGAGVRFISVEQKFSIISTDYTSAGLGFLLRAEGNTALSKNVYANIGADIRYDLNGEPEYNGTKITNLGEPVNINTFSVGVHLGISIIL